ncbi:MAG TPA: translocation/assembly module TamB domain-containing protein [Candidatus Acidoferrum sp.]|jgi:translocation and assembly module TamB
MTERRRHPIWAWIIHTPWVLAVLCILAVVGFFGSGAGNPLIRRLVIQRVESITGRDVEVRTVSIRWLAMGVTLKGLVIRGNEPTSTEPLFSAEEVRVGLRVDSFWGRKVSLNDLLLRQPRVHLRVEKNGASNVPMLNLAPGGQQGKFGDTVFGMRVQHVRIDDGWILYNDVKTPMAVEGGDLQFVIDLGGTHARPVYTGTFDWKSFQFTSNSFWPIPVSVTSTFTLTPDGFTIEQASVEAKRSHFDGHIEMTNFEKPKWSFRYRGWVNLLDLRESLRSAETPTGLVDVRGDATYADGKFNGTGSYAGSEITLTYLPIFHASGLSSRGDVTIDNKGLVVNNFLAQAFGGKVTGKVSLRFDGLFFRGDTHIEGMRLAQVFPAIEEKGFPVDELHWDSILSGDSVETWKGGFEHFDIAAKVLWTSPDDIAENHIPVDATWTIRYQYDQQLLEIPSGEFETPSSRGNLTGHYGATESELDLKVETGALESYRDFINAIQGAKPGSPDEVKVLTGAASWDGKIEADASGTGFNGHIRAERARHENITVDLLDGDIVYSPDELTLTRAHLRRGAIDTLIDGNLKLTDWSFLPDNTWSVDASFDATPMDALQELVSVNYPVHGKVTGQFHGRGTRREPNINGLFDLADGEVYGVLFNRLRGQITATRDEVRIADAELRLFAPGTEVNRGAGIVTGTAEYRMTDQNISVDLVGASIPLANFSNLQTERFPVGGLVSFRVKATGPVTAPDAEGTFRVVDLQVGRAVIGSFEGELNSDGKRAKLTLSSSMNSGELSGAINLGLSDPFNLDGKVAIKNIDLDPFLARALHVDKFEGHGSAEGEIAINGALRHPETIIVDAQFSHLQFNYASVQLENAGPIHFRSSRDNLEIVSAGFRGANTNMQVDGNVQFSGARKMDLRLNGEVDLRFLSSFSPSMSSSGSAQVNAVFAGTLSNPSITGRIHIENAAGRVSDFPTGLSAISGDLIFDATRLHFENLTAQAGGGTLHLTGSVNYTERPVRYDVTARSDGTRVRYPEGMSWLTAGSLRLTGTTDGGLLSGRVTVERVTLAGGLEVAGSLFSTKEGIAGPSTSSPFLRNLQFDIQAVSTPDARMQWPGAELEAEADLRVRGTWEHPIILGHIHVLSGDLLFHGNRYRVARGDINFANPFRLDPVLNVEASTTIQQYEITLNFNGPASKLTLAYRSDPPLPAQDIVTLLALGQTSSEGTSRSAGNSQSTAGATALLSEAVSSQVGGRLEKLFGITNFRVDPALVGVGSTGTGQNAAARVTVQQQVTRNITITYISNVGSTQEQVIQVEYNLNRNVSIVALRDYNGTFGIDVKIKKRFP